MLIDKQETQSLIEETTEFPPIIKRDFRETKKGDPVYGS